MVKVLKKLLLLNLGDALWLGLEVTNGRMIHKVPRTAVSGVLTNCHGHGEKKRRLIRDAYVYLTQNTYPAGSTANEKQVIRKKSLKLQISDSGELSYCHKQSGR